MGFASLNPGYLLTTFCCCKHQERAVRIVLTILALAFVAAIYSGHRIVTATHLHAEPSPVPGMPKEAEYRDTAAALEQRLRIMGERSTTNASGSATDVLQPAQKARPNRSPGRGRHAKPRTPQ